MARLFPLHARLDCGLEGRGRGGGALRQRHAVAAAIARAVAGVVTLRAFRGRRATAAGGAAASWYDGGVGASLTPRRPDDDTAGSTPR